MDANTAGFWLHAVLTTALSGVAIFAATLWIDARRNAKERRALLRSVRAEILHNAEALRLWSPLVGYPPFRSAILEHAVSARLRLLPDDEAFEAAIHDARKALDNLRESTRFWRDLRLGQIPEAIAEAFDDATIDAHVRVSRVIGLYQLQKALERTDAALGERTEPLTDERWAQDARGLAGVMARNLRNPFLTPEHRDLLDALARIMEADARVAEAAHQHLA
jgi:hypothetical protein